eukprot:403653-Rhodomonas_salina.4
MSGTEIEKSTVMSGTGIENSTVMSSTEIENSTVMSGTETENRTACARNTRCPVLRSGPERMVLPVRFAYEIDIQQTGWLCSYARATLHNQVRETAFSVQIVPGTRCLVFEFAVYAMPGTDLAYGACAICLRGCYAMPGTDLSYAPTIPATQPAPPRCDPNGQGPGTGGYDPRAEQAAG